MNRTVLLITEGLSAAAIAALIAACASAAHQVAGDAPADCYVAPDGVTLTPPSTGVEWLCANPDTDPTCWDDLGKRVVPELVAKLLATEKSRQSCAGFIQDLHRRRVLLKE